MPREARVAIVGGGYAGLAAALELARHGVEAVVLEAGALGVGASTRNGGSVSGGVNIGKSFSGRAAEVDPERAHRLLCRRLGRVLADRAADRGRKDRVLLAEARPLCRRLDPEALRRQEKRLRRPQRRCRSPAPYMVPRERQREEIASDYYYGGMVVERSASLHPALYYKGLLDACRRRGIAICAEAAVEKITREWRPAGGSRPAAAR